MDLFSAAVCLFIFAVGYPPFKKATRRDRFYKWICANQIDNFWIAHEKVFCHNKVLSNSFKDLINKMLCYKWDDRLSLEDIKKHEWFNESVSTTEEISYMMRLRHKDSKTSKFGVSQKSIFNDIDIPNDDDVNLILSKRTCKGLKLKKYSKYFRMITGDVLLSAIISFAESKGISYKTDSVHETVLLETNNDDVKVSLKANILKNPSSEQRCIECVKLSGEKISFMQMFFQIWEHCISLEAKFAN